MAIPTADSQLTRKRPSVALYDSLGNGFSESLDGCLVFQPQVSHTADTNQVSKLADSQLLYNLVHDQTNRALFYCETAVDSDRKASGLYNVLSSLKRSPGATNPRVRTVGSHCQRETETHKE